MWGAEMPFVSGFVSRFCEISGLAGTVILVPTMEYRHLHNQVVRLSVEAIREAKPYNR
jgi:hypothetical protein